jgi:hypothetical protein
MSFPNHAQQNWQRQFVLSLEGHPCGLPADLSRPPSRLRELCVPTSVPSVLRLFSFSFTSHLMCKPRNPTRTQPLPLFPAHPKLKR